MLTWIDLGLVKPDIVFYGESLPPRFRTCIQSDFPKCDLLIVIGTSLVVQPFASLVTYPDHDTPRVLINKQRAGDTLDNGFNFNETGGRDLFIQGDCDEVVSKIANDLGWGKDLNKMIHKRQSRR
mmetsp:Transcript_27919/g.49274  ORF Transcript_27919/g.49274 Transcript_27919/m.49274 type:complete len:125 (-) Transcript_27919:23-397(-)